MSWQPLDDDGRTHRLAALTGLSLAVGCAVGGYYYWRAQNAPVSYSASGFDVSQVDARAPETATYVPPARAQPASSPRPLVGAAVGMTFGGPAPNAPKFQKAGASPEDIKQEQEWLKRNGFVLRQYMGRMRSITTRHYRGSPVVREVDRAFGSMPRYMAIQKKYAKEGNPFGFAREAIMLPEVRAEIRKRMADPRVWRESVFMVLETLRDPPPAAIYKEIQRFVTKDPSMVDYMPEFTGQVTNNVGTAMQGIPKEADLGPLQRVMQDVSPNSMPALPAQAAAPRR